MASSVVPIVHIIVTDFELATFFKRWLPSLCVMCVMFVSQLPV